LIPLNVFYLEKKGVMFEHETIARYYMNKANKALQVFGQPPAFEIRRMGVPTTHFILNDTRQINRNDKKAH
jgi:hypothetical protein